MLDIVFRREKGFLRFNYQQLVLISARNPFIDTQLLNE